LNDICHTAAAAAAAATAALLCRYTALDDKELVNALWLRGCTDAYYRYVYCLLQHLAAAAAAAVSDVLLQHWAWLDTKGQDVGRETTGLYAFETHYAVFNAGANWHPAVSSERAQSVSLGPDLG
jgi:hypothetical protein